MKTRLLTWNPLHKAAGGAKWLEDVVAELKRTGRRKGDQWSSGPIRDVEEGERVFLLRQGSDAPGLIGSGWVTAKSFEAAHWIDEKAEAGAKANFIEVEWDSMVAPKFVLKRSQLLRGILPSSFLNSQWSGREIPADLAFRLERKWEMHLNSVSLGVVRISRPSKGVPIKSDSTDDTMDDLKGAEIDDLGSDGAAKKERIASGVSRDPAVRRAVIKRSKQICERPGCGSGRDFPGFLDVHHIFGAENSDRVWTCVALCPNCHREAHYSPENKKINRQLRIVAERFRR